MPKYTYDLTRGRVKLKRVLKKRNIRMTDLAPIMGCSYRLLKMKVSGHAKLQMNDMKLLKQVLRLTPEQAWNVFFEDETKKKE